MNLQSSNISSVMNVHVNESSTGTNVLILLNKDSYYHLGGYQASGDNISSRVCSAWMSALRVDADVFSSLVHFPENPIYVLDRGAPEGVFLKVKGELIYRASYLAKKQTKLYGNGSRAFGCSQR